MARVRSYVGGEVYGGTVHTSYGMGRRVFFFVRYKIADTRERQDAKGPLCITTVDVIL